MDIHLINRQLSDLYGRDFLNQPIYRIIWSEDEIEKRFSTFRDWVPGTNVLIREVTEVREVKKYSTFQPQWILEKLFVNRHNTEILDNSTFAPQSCTYEPMWSFGYDKNGKVRRPVWRAIQLLITCINNPEKLTPSQMDDKEFEQARQDEKIMMNLMEQYIPNDTLHSAIKDGDAVMLNSDYNPDRLPK